MSGKQTHCTLRVDVIFATGGHAPAKLRVRLVRTMNQTPIGESMTNSSGTAEFSDLEPGEYAAIVSGDGIETASSDTIEVNDWSVFLSKTVAVQPTVQARPSPQAITAGTSLAVSAVDLNVPPKAGKEYDRGNAEMVQQDWAKAIEHFNKATEIDPEFSAAYNNLAVCYGHMGNRAKEREALRQAIALNERCVPALVNLAYLDMHENQLAPAGELLDKALIADPINVEALAYLADVELAEQRYESSIAAARRAHSLPHERFAGVHYTAASALEREGRIREAIAELQIFLQEAPQNPRAEGARKAMAAMQAEAP
jgi:tetratricopeptide (TPR) repeat protein